jgi:hypothetical protein
MAMFSHSTASSALISPDRRKAGRVRAGGGEAEELPDLDLFPADEGTSFEGTGPDDRTTRAYD